MLTLHQNFPLRNLNTFRVEASARWYTEINQEDDLKALFSDSRWQNVNRLILGGGSNILFTRDFDGLVIKMNIRGITHTNTSDEILVTCGAGESWNELVNYCVDRNFYGMENLSLIPGSVGASPVQNIGAYGVELKDIFYTCRAFEIKSGELKDFNNSDCRFAYRESIFKNELKGQYIITQVTFILSAKEKLNLSYDAIEQELKTRGITEPTLKDVSDVVSAIRVNKLPDPSTIGNAGSFFKNPVIKVTDLRQLQYAFPDIVHYPAGGDHSKLAAGWLIEQCGWKGSIDGHTGTWKNQALVVVNHGNASGIEILRFSDKIIKSVKEKFGIVLEKEVNII